MKNSFFLFILILICQNGFTQSFCETLVPSYYKFPDCSDVVRSEILAFNEMVKHYELKDTIQYECVENNTIFYFKNKPLIDWKYDPKLCGEKLMLRYGKYASSFTLLASIPLGDGIAQIYEVIKPNKGKNRIIFKTYQEQGILPFGEYLEKNCAGQIIVKGNYKLLNTPSNYSYSRYDDETKQHVKENIENDKTSSRRGIWKYYNEQGDLIKEENYTANKFNADKPPFDICSKDRPDFRWNYYKTSEKISKAIDFFNAININLGRKWFINYDITQRGIVYYLNGEIIKNPFFNMNGKYKPWAYQIKHHGDNLLLEFSKKQLRAYIPTAENKGEILIFNDHTFSSGPTIDIFQAVDFDHNGKYERRTCNGNLITQGVYITKDTSFVSREKKLSRETYKLEWVETKIERITMRRGNWKYYDENEKLVLEENYPGLGKWTGVSDYLCAKLNEEIRAMNKNIRNPFMNFNAICSQLGIQSWLSQDDILDQKTYYLNGQLINAPEDISKTNYRDDFRFITPKGTIELYANTRTSGAFSKRKKERKLNYSILFKPNDTKQVRLSFYKNKLKREETKDNQVNGVYEEKQCNGELLVKGQYCQIDSIYRDTISTINTETYEEEIKIAEYDKAKKKYGSWKYYNTDGVLIREENFGKCKSE